MKHLRAFRLDHSSTWNYRLAACITWPVPWLISVLVLGILSGCGDTEGTSSAFKQKQTTNSDFVQHIIPTGDYPIGLAVGMFGGTNGFAITNYVSGSVSAFLQTAPASTTFARQDIGVGFHPTQILIADLHGAPAHPDVVAVTESAASNNIVVLENDGAESFLVAYEYASGAVIQQVSAGCVQNPCAGGTAQDLVMTTSADSLLRVLLNDGTGNFSPAAISLGEHPGRFALADFNGDGNLDVAINFPAKDMIQVHFGDGTGAFPSAIAYGTNQYPVAVVAAPLRSGVTIDLVVSARDKDRVDFFLGDGSGGFSSGGAGSVKNHPEMLLVANFTGNPDVVVVNRGETEMTFFDGDGAGGFTASAIGTSHDPFDIADGFFTSSGFRDMVVTELKDRILGVYSGNGAGGFSRTQIAFASQVTQPKRVNFCGGAKNDVLLVQSFVDQVLLLCNVN